MVKKQFQFLVIGQGGREHAICHRLSFSSYVRKPVLSWPGHPWLKSVPGVEVLNGSLDDILENRCYDAVVIGPEKYLEDGLADRLEDLGIPCFGPNKESAQLETSKRFAKEFMQSAGIATARFDSFTDRSLAKECACSYLPAKVVIKASGLAAGKGVFICETQGQIEEALEAVFTELSSKEVVIEEFLSGQESSFFVGLGLKPSQGVERLTPMGFVADYKRLHDGNMGPNTGGMGGYAPLHWLPNDAEIQVMESIVHPLILELKRRSMNYVGFLYVGLMWVGSHPYVIEFNTRLGDPEAQILACSYGSDWGEFIAYHLGLVNQIERATLTPAVGVVMTGEHYPKSQPVSTTYNLNSVLENPISSSLFVAGSTIEENVPVSVPGRALCIVSTGDSIAQARSTAYEHVQLIHQKAPRWHYRKDIASDID